MEPEEVSVVRSLTATEANLAWKPFFDKIDAFQEELNTRLSLALVEAALAVGVDSKRLDE